MTKQMKLNDIRISSETKYGYSRTAFESVRRALEDGAILTKVGNGTMLVSAGPVVFPVVDESGFFTGKSDGDVTIEDKVDAILETFDAYEDQGAADPDCREKLRQATKAIHDYLKSAPPLMTECGTFTDHGLGFHKQKDAGVEYMMAWPIEDQEGYWALFSSSYSLEDPDRDDFWDKKHLDGALLQHGFKSLEDLQASHPNDWREFATRCIASEQSGSRWAAVEVLPSDLHVINAFADAGAPVDKVAIAMNEAIEEPRGESGIEALAESARTGSEAIDTGVCETALKEL